MIGLIVTGHGHFATGLTTSLNLIAGDAKDYVAVDFEATDSTDDLAKKLTDAMDSLKDCEGIMASSRELSPFMRSPMRKLPAWAGVSLPSMSAPKLRDAMSAVRSSRRARCSNTSAMPPSRPCRGRMACGKLPSRRSPSGVRMDSG